MALFIKNVPNWSWSTPHSSCRTAAPWAASWAERHHLHAVLSELLTSTKGEHEAHRQQRGKDVQGDGPDLRALPSRLDACSNGFALALCIGCSITWSSLRGARRRSRPSGPTA